MVWLFGLTIVLILSFYWAKGGLVKEGQSQKKTDYDTYMCPMPEREISDGQKHSGLWHFLWHYGIIS